MAFGYPLTMPATPGFRASRFGLAVNATVHESPLSRVQQVSERPGAHWFAEFVLPPMKRASAAAWIAFLNELRGPYGTFEAFDPDAKAPRGTATGTPLVKGAGQGGHTLATDGWTPNATGILRAGDYIALALPSRRLHQVIADADTNASGEATLAIVPPLRESPTDNGAITVTNATGLFRLTARETVWDADHAAVFGLGFTAREAL